MLQDTAVGSPTGVLYKEAQPAAASAALKPEPARDTTVKDSPLAGVRVIVGVTAKLPVPTFPAAVTTVIVQVPPCAVALTVKEAVRAPEELTVQVGVGTPAKRLGSFAVMLLHAPASVAVKVPVTCTAPTVVGPVYGLSVSVTGVPLMKVAVAVSGRTPGGLNKPVTEIVYKPFKAVFKTVKPPETVPSVLRVHEKTVNNPTGVDTGLAPASQGVEAATCSKPEPAIVIIAPPRPTEGVKTIRALT